MGGGYGTAKKRLLEISVRVFGDTHPYTLTFLSLEAEIMANQGLLEEATKHQAIVVAYYQDLYGKEHPDTLNTMACLGGYDTRAGVY